VPRSTTPPEPVDGQVPLFDIPKVYRAPKRKTSPATERWTKFTGRATCDVCIINVYDGISDTVLSRAKHALIRGDRRWLLCHVHATQIRNGERKLNG
jgi:hypothetical protein